MSSEHCIKVFFLQKGGVESASRGNVPAKAFSIIDLIRKFKNPNPIIKKTGLTLQSRSSRNILLFIRTMKFVQLHNGNAKS